MKTVRSAVVLVCCLTASAALTRAAEPVKAAVKEMNGLPLVFHKDFRDGDKALVKFEFTNPATWKIAQDGGKNVLSLFEKSTKEPPVRSPYGRALVKDLWVGPFVMEVKLKSTVKDYGHRDLCLFFGANDDSHLYYVHLGKKPDPNCGNIFIVNGAPRKNLLPPQEKGVDWDDNYHIARLVRGDDGSVEVFFDGKSLMKVNDKTFPVGRVGVGSFDDLGNFTEVTVWGKKAEKPPAGKTAAAAK